MDTPDSTTLKRCTKCGEEKPRDQFNKNKDRKDGLSDQCKTCRAKYHEANRERISEKGKAWYEANRERRADVGKAWYEANREYVRNKSKTWREANRERKATTDAQWRKTNQSSVAANHHRRRARKKGNGGTCTAAELDSIRAAQTDKKGRLICWRCGKPITDTPHLDHWIPLSKGGTNDAGNLRYMHAKCNMNKGAKLPHEIGRLL